ncbi:MAG TPA: ferritin-like domain-containing protein [Tepidisphaeraceae bacterium]|jgi:ferritin-like metal-binding protein YciE|nr:ferritin-like domain-containing protein [Tepidisphaeraceae bacterium]
MAIFSEEFNNLNDFFIHELESLYDVEKRLAEALPKMAEAAHDSQLKSGFQMHTTQTEEHARRLENIFAQLGREPKRETSDAIKGIISEGDDIASAKGNDMVRDAALITAGQKAEHFEMAGYGSARTHARQLGFDDIAKTLQQTLNEEGETDKKLTEIAERAVNMKAPQGEPTHA